MPKQTENGRLYTLSYEVGGTILHTEQRCAGDVLSDLFVPTVPHFVFAGWENAPAFMPADDLTLHGNLAAVRYRAVFASGVEQYGIAELPFGAPIVPPAPPEREGYDFAGWRDLPDTMPDHDAVFEALFTPKEYTVTYCVDGAMRFSFTCHYGDPFPTVETPRKDHYTFSGWSETPATVPARDVTVTGTFTENLYHLTRLIDGKVFREDWLPFGAKIDRKLKPTREGYYFSGWRKLPARMPAEDVTVAASMYPARYRVSFVLDGVAYHSVYVPYGSPIEAPIPPTGDRVFGGWSDLPALMPAHDITVHGSMSSRMYTLVYMTDGHETYRTSLPEGSSLPQNILPPEREGCVFSGWDGEPETMPPHDLTLNASFSAAVQHYVFRIDGELFREVTVGEGESLSVPEPPERDGRTFGGWDSVEVDAATGVTIYSGSYADATCPVLRFTVRGETVFAAPTQPGTPIVPPVLSPDPTYVFEKWENLPDVMPEGDLTVIARVRVLRYRLQFVADETPIYSMLMREGASISCPAVAPKEGYHFTGWRDVPKRMPAENLVIHGSYELNTHTVTYMIGGELFWNTRVSFGTPIPTPKAPDRPGESFAGWDLPDLLMPDHDLTVSGSYSPDLCTADIYVDGLLYTTVRTPVGTPIPLPELETGAGEHFEWHDAPDTAPAGRVDIHGGRVGNLYTVTYLSDGIAVGRERYAWGERVCPRLSAPAVSGASFLGWEGIPDTMPAQDITLTAKYTTRYAHATFLLDGKVFCEEDVPVGSPTPNPTVPERVGYCFDGWHNWGAVMPAYDFTAYGNYTRRRYTVTYLVTGETLAVQEYLAGETVTPPVAPERDHSVFRAWEGLPDVMPAEDVTVSARYAGDLFRVTYLLDGEIYHESSTEIGSRILPPVPPEKEGYVFGGWQGITAFMPDHDLTVTGCYEESTYTVTYKVGGMIYRVDTYEVGAEITPPTPPDHEHEVFVRWRNFSRTMPDYDFICTAEYTDTIRHYSFVLDGNLLASGDCRKGEALFAPPVREKPGYTFSGWQDYTGVMPGSDVVYTASYLPNAYSVRYVLDGKVYHEESCRRGSPLSPPSPPRQTGFAFSGWEQLPAVMPGYDLCVEGHMIPRKYRLTYVADATAVFDADVDCGARLGKVVAPQMHGYVFGGWDGEPTVMPPHALTVTGTYREEKPQYKAITTGERFGAEQSVKRLKLVHHAAMAIVSGSTLRLIIRGGCYAVEGASRFLRNSRVIDAAGLAAALRETYRAHFLPHLPIHLIVNSAADTDRTLEGKPCSREEMRLVADNLFGAGHRYAYGYLSENRSAGTRRLLISAVEEQTADDLSAAFAKCGVMVTGVNTVFGELTAYLQPNPKLRNGQHTLCLYYLQNAIAGVLMVHGQVAYLTGNRYPFYGGVDRVRETEEIVRSAQRYLEEMAPGEVISTLAIGGVDRDRVQEGRPRAEALLRRDIHGGTTSAGKPVQGLRVLRLRYLTAKNRVK